MIIGLRCNRYLLKNPRVGSPRRRVTNRRPCHRINSSRIVAKSVSNNYERYPQCSFSQLSTRLYSALVSWEIAEDSDEKVGIITLKSPRTYNALTVDMGKEFEALVSQLEHELVETGNSNSNVSAIVLCGEGDKAFSAGGDLEWLKSLSENSVHSNVDLMLKFYKSFLCLREKLPIPVVAALHGPAMGAGACLALACDLRVGASGNAPLLGFPFSRLGIPSGMGALHLLQNCSKLSGPEAAEILLLGKTLTGEEALKLGMLNKLVPPETVKEEAKSLAVEITKRSHPVAVRSLVRSLRLGTDHNGGDTLANSLYRDAHAQAMCYNRKDWGEGLDAVASRRDPEFENYHCK